MSGTGNKVLEGTETMQPFEINKAVIWAQLSAAEQAALLKRPALSNPAALNEQVKTIIETVQQEGDNALLSYTERFDQVKLTSPVMTLQKVQKQADLVTPQVKQAIDQAYTNIYAFHQAQMPQAVSMQTMPGVNCEMRFAALERVGLYIPGGSASLPSTVLMCAIPAQIAGCAERILISPPSAEYGGLLSPAICYAALKCGVTQVCLGGGAQAIAALASGTASIPAVDKIIGPGNSFVTAAKQYVSQLPGGPAIDLPAGPSELLIIADDSAEPAFVAADLLSQAEHGPDSQVLLISPSAELIEATRVELEKQLKSLARAGITKQALSASNFIKTASLSEAAEISQKYAPEHLSLQVRNPEQWVEPTNKAGSLFLGHYAPESGGDYATGTNHVLPTYGYARNYSSLGLADFYRRYTVQQLSPQGLKSLAPTITALAAEENLQAHSQAVSLRLDSLRMQNDLNAASNENGENENPTSLAQQMLRPHLRTVKPYASARRSMSGGRIWLNANESPYTQAYQVNTSQLNRYPNFQSSELNTAYASYAGVSPAQVLSHRGSDEAIDILIRSFCEPGADRIMICTPTYGMYGISAQLNNTPVVEVPLLKHNWQLDVTAIKEQSDKVKLVFLCNPSNPLGNLLNKEDVLQVITYFKGRALVVLDEAYIEYTNSQSFVTELAQYDNLIITRTLSKAFGLAGIRVGFTLASPAVIKALVPVLAPYPLPDVSIQIARQALRAENLLEMRQNTIEVQGERDLLASALANLPYVLKVEDSSTNFILFHVNDAEAVIQHCLQQGILLRNQSSQQGLSNSVRATIGAPAENQQLIEVLQSFNEGSQA